MKFGITAINIQQQPAEMLAVARAAEAAGLESVWTAERVVTPLTVRSRYPYTADGRMPLPPNPSFIEPFIALSAIATQTRGIRIGTGVAIVPQHNPAIFAKQVASLDVLSGGRLILGLGWGWMREEYAAAQVPFERRGARFDDYVAAMLRFWSGATVEHEGEFVQWHGFTSFPVPIRKSALPLTIGGHGGRTFERVVRLGGWFTPDRTAAQLAVDLRELRARCDASERDFGTVEITSMRTDPSELDDAALLDQLAALGVHRLCYAVWGPVQQRLEMVEKIGRLAAVRH